MTSSVHTTTNYRITFETFNGFFGVWLKCNLFTRPRLLMTLTLSGALFLASIIATWPVFSNLFSGPNLVPGLNILSLVLMGIVGLLIWVLTIAVAVYVLFPLISYLWLATNFAIGPVRKRVNNADLSEQGITKSYEAYSQTTSWGDVHDLVETRKSLLIFTSRNSAMMIPKAAFPTHEAAVSFANAAQTFWHAAKLEKQETPPPQA